MYRAAGRPLQSLNWPGVPPPGQNGTPASPAAYTGSSI